MAATKQLPKLLSMKQLVSLMRHMQSNHIRALKYGDIELQSKDGIAPPKDAPMKTDHEATMIESADELFDFSAENVGFDEQVEKDPDFHAFNAGLNITKN